MSQRRSEHDGIAGDIWLKTHRYDLWECGIPQEATESIRRWAYLLHHGDDAFGTRWTCDWITPEQATKLLELFAKETTNSDYRLFFLKLRKRSQDAD
jgi:hypothetical protein